jgi:GT2 family glycosyltransferase
VFEQIGILDVSLFMYAEEVDFCWRASLAGFRFACITSAHIWHKISKSSLSERPLMRYLRIRNQIYFYRRYSHGIQLLLPIIFTFIRIILIAGSDFLGRHQDLFLPSFRGWFNGWFSKNIFQKGYLWKQ